MIANGSVDRHEDVIFLDIVDVSTNINSPPESISLPYHCVFYSR